MSTISNPAPQPPTPSNVLEAAILAADPLRFINLCWPGTHVYDKQLAVLLSVRDNLQTLVPAANQTGKTWIAAMIALWWFASRTPARVILSSSSESQLRSILWNEILHLINSSAYPLPFHVSSLRIEKLKNPQTQETEARDYILGAVTNAVESFQGHHLPNDRPRVLAIFDEASGVPDEFFDAALSWAHRILVIGNPLPTTNFFYRGVKAGDAPDPAGLAPLLRKVIRIDGRDSPNVQIGRQWKKAQKAGPAPLLIPGLLTYEDYRRRKQEWDAPKREPRLRGRFYEGDQAFLIPQRWLDRAMNARRWEALERQDRQALAMGVDVAAGGRDRTCWTVIDDLGIIEQIVMDTPNTMEICGRTIRLIETHGLEAEFVAIDAGGGGKQIADRLVEQGFDVREAYFGQRATVSHAHRNLRAEVFALLRHTLDPRASRQVFALPPDAHELRRELSAVPLQYDSEGKLLLPAKSELRKIIGHSPDRSDSLCLALWIKGVGESVYDPDFVAFAPGENLEVLPHEQPKHKTALDRYLEETLAHYDEPRDDWDLEEEDRHPRYRPETDSLMNAIAAGLSRLF